MSFISYFADGTSLGNVYASIALGYTMAYSIAKVLSFARGDVITIEGFVVFTAANGTGLSPIVDVPLVVAICAVLGVAIERVTHKPLRVASSLTILVITVGVSYLLQNLVLLIFKVNPKFFPFVVIVPAIKLTDGQLTISGETIVMVITCVMVMIGLSLFIKKVKAGQTMLAVSEDKGAAQLMGIGANGTIALAFAIGSALVAITGVLLCSAYSALSPYTGTTSNIKTFVVAMFGGISSVPRAFIDRLLLGVIKNLSKAYISPQLSDAIMFDMLVLMLLMKPAGILGRKMNKEV